jgi:GNAT superfamily N-acetyltransferase
MTTRWATAADIPALRALMARAIDALQVGLLSPDQIAASRAVMGLDTQLIADGTYLIAERDGAIAGCGGWSRRATLYGGDHSSGLRDPGLLDPARDPARIRAMYTHPDFARQGVGRRILAGCEQAAAAHGFAAVELMATLSGERLYAVSGYTPVERVEAMVDGIAVPLVRMRKAL